MIENSRMRLVVLAGAAAGITAIMSVTCAPAVADPMPVPVPAPAPVIQNTAAPQLTTAPLTQQAATVPATPSAAAAAPTLVPATSGTLMDYLKSKGVRLEAQRADGFKALSITLPMPTGWTQIPDPNVPDAFAVIANRASPDLYTPNAALVVYKLVGDFDPKEAITHGFVDSQSLTAWQSTDASLADFEGFPASIIEGTYRQNDMTLNTSRRHVIETSGNDKYLVSLSVTSQANSQGATDAADATDAIVNGFRVVPPTPGAAPPTAPPVLSQ